MSVRAVHDRDELAALLCRDPALHAYELGDLDDFFWPWTTWYRRGDEVALLYHGAGAPTPTLIALSSAGAGGLAPLVAGLAPLLPRRFYAHLSPGVVGGLGAGFEAVSQGLHRKLVLTDVSRLVAGRVSVVVLTEVDLPQVSALYEVAYPGNWFDPRMLATGQYVGVWGPEGLLAVAGVHVWSPRYAVAALGNVTTHPAARRRGLGRAVVVALCRRLLDGVDRVTLNVRVDNVAALALYAGLGFTAVADYEEFVVSAR